VQCADALCRAGRGEGLVEGGQVAVELGVGAAEHGRAGDEGVGPSLAAPLRA